MFILSKFNHTQTNKVTFFSYNCGLTSLSERKYLPFRADVLEHRIV